MYRCHPQWKTVREIIESGRIGEVRILEAAFAFNMGPAYDNIRLINAAGGGGLLDVGCYCVSFCRLIAGEEPTQCHAVAHIGSKSRVDEQATGVLKFPSGIVAYFACGVQCSVPTAAKIHGSEGSLSVTSPWFGNEDTDTLIVNAGGKAETISVKLEHNLYANEALAVARHIDDRQCPAMSWDDSLGQVRTLDALRTGMGLVFDCEKG